MDNTHSVRAGAFLAAIVREVDPVSRLVSIGDVDAHDAIVADFRRCLDGFAA